MRVVLRGTVDIAGIVTQREDKVEPPKSNWRDWTKLMGSLDSSAGSHRGQ